MAHISMIDPKRVLAPPVDLGRGRSPENIVEEYITETAQRPGYKPSKGYLRSGIECG
jgi:hypothetical protein